MSSSDLLRPSVLMVTTSHNRLSDSNISTGVWLEELTTPYYYLVDSQVDVTIASIKGGAIPIDPNSLKTHNEAPESVRRFLNDQTGQHYLKESPAINSIVSEKYDAIFFPGGHGAMWDLPNSQHLADIVTAIYNNGGIVSSVCHGAAGLLSALDYSGQPLVSNKRITSFTNSEEEAVDLIETVPFLLESRLKEYGADFRSGPDFSPFIIQDARLITGQNAASAKLIGHKILTGINLFCRIPQHKISKRHQNPLNN